MRYDFEHVPDRRPTDSIKWNEYDEDVLPLWVADMDFPVAEPVLRSLRARVEHGIFGYPDVHPKPGTVSELQEVLVERMQQRYNWRLAPEDIMLLPGVIVGLNLACQAVGSQGEGVLIQTPVYPPFFRTACNAGMLLQESQLARKPTGIMKWIGNHSRLLSLARRVFSSCVTRITRWGGYSARKSWSTWLRFACARV